MDTKNPYEQINHNLNEINREHLQMINQEPPAYNPASAPAHPSTAVTVTTSNVAMPPGIPIMPQPVGPQPANMICPHCRCRITTRVNHRSTSKTHIACLLLSWTL